MINNHIFYKISLPNTMTLFVQNTDIVCSKHCVNGKYVSENIPLSRVPTTATFLNFISPISAFALPQFADLLGVCAKSFKTFLILSQKFWGLWDENGNNFGEGAEHVKLLIFSV